MKDILLNYAGKVRNGAIQGLKWGAILTLCQYNFCNNEPVDADEKMLYDLGEAASALQAYSFLTYFLPLLIKNVGYGLLLGASSGGIYGFFKLKEEMAYFEYIKNPLVNSALLETSANTDELFKIAEEKGYICSISKQIMDEPVQTPYSSLYYDKRLITEWIHTYGNDPVQRDKPLALIDLIYNQDLKKEIDTFLGKDEAPLLVAASL